MRAVTPQPMAESSSSVYRMQQQKKNDNSNYRPRALPSSSQMKTRNQIQDTELSCAIKDGVNSLGRIIQERNTGLAKGKQLGVATTLPFFRANNRMGNEKQRIAKKTNLKSTDKQFITATAPSPNNYQHARFRSETIKNDLDDESWAIGEKQGQVRQHTFASKELITTLRNNVQNYQDSVRPRDPSKNKIYFDSQSTGAKTASHVFDSAVIRPRSSLNVNIVQPDSTSEDATVSSIKTYTSAINATRNDNLDSQQHVYYES